MKRLACALALAGCASALLSAPRDARAAPARASSGLQLSILTPDPATIGDRMSLDVSFRGSAVETVELYLDNALVAKRQLNTAQSRGVITFSLETVFLTEGAHEVLVKAFGPDSKPTITSTRIQIPAADLSAPVRIAYPQNGIQVSGLVPVRVNLAPDIQKLRPYVTFFVDKEFKVLRNYPPYEFQWDSTKVANGWHMLEAWTQASDALSPTKARPVHVNVNNGGGATRRQDTIADLRSENPSRPVVLKPEPSTARTGAAVRPGMVEKATANPRTDARPKSLDGSLSAVEPTGYGYGEATRPVVGPTDPSRPPVRLQGPSPRMMGGAAVQPKERLAIASAPRNLLPGLGPTDPLYAVVAPARTGESNGTVTVKPGDTLPAISKRTGVRSQEIARLNNMRPDASLRPRQSLIVPQVGSFDVAFDGNLIAFDVRPRVEKGIRLAPFRQIFEHTGGRLYWFGGEAQTVRAVNETREIELKIGNAAATVNNRTVTMERSPYIVSGRTIVPLTFIRDSMGVKISFDTRSGRLLIESGK